MINTLKEYQWWDSCNSSSTIPWTSEWILRFSRVILAQSQEFDYSWSELEFKKEELNRMILKVQAMSILNVPREVPKFEPVKPSLRYRLKRFFKRREGKM